MPAANSLLIDPNDAALLLIDHQSGLSQVANNTGQPASRGNIIALAKLSRIANIPTVTTKSEHDGSNGALLPDVLEINPKAVQVLISGQINAWDNPDFVMAVSATERRTLIIAGTVNSVNLTFTTLSALAAGYRVCAVLDVPGNWNRPATNIAVARFVQAGAIPVDTVAVISEIMHACKSPAVGEIATILDECVAGCRKPGVFGKTSWPTHNSFESV
jgi:nicotinamidase-related amidase